MIFKVGQYKKIFVNENIENRRIDNFLFKLFKSVPKSMIYKIIRIGKVRINKKKIKPKQKLIYGDIVQIPYIKINKNKNFSFKISYKQKKLLTSSILYEDKFILVVNKPSGIAVHGGSGIDFGIIESFREIKPECNYLELVHRLDRETSGVLVLAKKYSILTFLHKQWKESRIKKKYVAIVHGHWSKRNTVVKNFLLKKIDSNCKKSVFINEKGKLSKTFFKVNKYNKSTTLMEITPVTGRTHQIRVHSACLGHPIVFDERYGNKELDNRLKNCFSEKKLFLHAKSLSFQYPCKKKFFFITAPLPHFLNNFLKFL